MFKVLYEAMRSETACGELSGVGKPQRATEGVPFTLNLSFLQLGIYPDQVLNSPPLLKATPRVSHIWHGMSNRDVPPKKRPRVTSSSGGGEPPPNQSGGGLAVESSSSDDVDGTRHDLFDLKPRSYGRYSWEGSHWESIILIGISAGINCTRPEKMLGTLRSITRH